MIVIHYGGLNDNWKGVLVRAWAVLRVWWGKGSGALSGLIWALHLDQKIASFYISRLLVCLDGVVLKGIFAAERYTRNTLHYQKYVDTRWTSHSKIMGINMGLVPPLLLQQPILFWEGFPLDVGTLLRGLAFIQAHDHWWGQALIRPGSQLAFQFIPKGVQWG